MTRWVRRWTRAFERWLLADGSARHLAMLRIAVGGYALGWLCFVTPELVGLGDLDPARFEPVGVVRLFGLGPLSSAGIAAVVGVTVIAGVAFTAGLRYRLSAPVFGLALLLLTTYQNSWGKLLHTENLLVVHVLVLAASPAAGALSLDRTPRRQAGAHLGWPVRVLALATVGAYLAAGVAKLRYAGWDWIDPENLRNWVAYDLVRKELYGDPYLAIATPALEHAWIFAPAAALTLLVELGAPLALVLRRLTRTWAVATWTLHAAVLAVMSVGFPYQLSGIPLVAVLLAVRPGSTGYCPPETRVRGDEWTSTSHRPGSASPTPSPTATPS